MRVLIIGAGRMGVRHAQGALKAKKVEEVCLVDISQAVLEKAATQFPEFIGTGKLRLAKPVEADGSYDIVIVATTARRRLDTCIATLAYNPKYILIVKPLGQSFQEVADIVDLFKDKRAKAYVNLNMRMYPFVKQLKRDLMSLPQFRGMKSVNYSGGAIGIGANGIHYIDLLYYLFDADRAEID